MHSADDFLPCDWILLLASSLLNIYCAIDMSSMADGTFTRVIMLAMKIVLTHMESDWSAGEIAHDEFTTPRSLSWRCPGSDWDDPKSVIDQSVESSCSLLFCCCAQHDMIAVSEMCHFADGDVGCKHLLRQIVQPWTFRPQRTHDARAAQSTQVAADWAQQPLHCSRGKSWKVYNTATFLLECQTFNQQESW